jgi:glycerol-1-phosphate dehydrogenase [NAD(P)+]
MSDAQFIKAVLYAPQTRPGRYTILEHLDLSEADVARLVREFGDAVAS